MLRSKTILVTGGTGQLGQSIKKIVKSCPDLKFVFADRHQLDFIDEQSIADFFKNKAFDVIINCAAYTAVDKAESEFELANQINHFAVEQLAMIAQENNSKLIHISTDYVFNGKECRPYIETDKLAPQSTYGQTKLDGESAIQRNMKDNALIIRTSWLFSEYGDNFVKTMLRLGCKNESLNVIFDQVGTPTYAKDLTRTIIAIVKSDNFSEATFKTQVLHFSNEGLCSWYDFAKTIFELANIECEIKLIESKDYLAPATRPHYSVLNKTKIKQNYNLTIPYWKDGLLECLEAIKDNE
jgi:dTDP-4-dehydrorhamnose reductase